ncbi:sugar transferase [Phycisphaerales bacterium]|nr:sugar transferase [Phycisphaerales bacterium]
MKTESDLTRSMKIEAEQSTLDPEIWGLSAPELHSAWWRGRGVQVVHRESEFPSSIGAEVYLLIPKDRLVVFDLEEVADELIWNLSDSTTFTLCERDSERYREEIRRTADGQVSGISRSYDVRESNHIPLELTTDHSRAMRWAAGSDDERDSGAANAQRSDLNFEEKLGGHAYNANERDEQKRFLIWLVASWVDLPRVLPDIVEIEAGIFALRGTSLPEDATIIAPMWLDSFIESSKDQVLVGPDLYFGEAAPNPGVERTRVLEIRDIQLAGGRRRKRFLARRTFYGVVKRILDFVVAALAITLLLPVFLAVAVLIVIDDGFPLFFGHTRQARGGKNFKCWKFRTMRRDAESMVEELQALNQADGPQVFIENDPRVTRIGHYLRKFQIDELPQLWNVVCGKMSFVGPRPSPDGENQFCPAWRELRLSVRPGITGLWQVSRTRAPGEDFQEWIKYDIEYVRRASLAFDIKIFFRTIRGIILRN